MNWKQRKKLTMLKQMKAKRWIWNENLLLTRQNCGEQEVQEAEGQDGAADSSDNDGDVDADFEEVNDDK